MASLDSNAVPPNLQRTIAKVNNYKRQVVKLLPDSSSSVSAGGALRVKFPTNLICNMSSLQMHGDLEFTSTTNQVYSPAPEQYINQLDFRMGGTSVLHINNYGDYFQTLANLTLSSAHQRSRWVMQDGLGPHQEYEPSLWADSVARNTRETTANTNTVTRAGYAATVTATYTSVGGALALGGTGDADGIIQVGDSILVGAGKVATVFTRTNANNFVVTAGLGDEAATAAWVHYPQARSTIKRDKYDALNGTYYPVTNTWIGLGDLGHIDLSMCPQSELELTFNGNGILAEATPDATWAYTNVYFTIEAIQYPTLSNALYQSVTPAPEAGFPGGEVYYCFERPICLMFGKDTSSSVDLKFSVASSSLDRVIFSHKANGYATQAAKSEGNPPNYWIFTDTDNSQKLQQLQLFIEERVYPNFQILNGSTAYAANYEGGSCFAHNLREMSVHNDNMFDCSIESEQEFKRCKFACVWNFENLSGGDGMLSGVNTMGLSSGMRLHFDWTGPPNAGGNYLVFCKTKAILAVGAGRNVRVEL